METLVESMQMNSDFGMASALLLFPNEDRVQFYKAVVDRSSAWHEHLHVNTPLDSGDWPTTESDFIPACSILMRSKALSQVGLFDESFGTSWEDYDLCLRFIDAGWKNVTVGNARVEHRSHQTTGGTSPYITYYMTRNRLICLMRYGQLWTSLRSLPFILRTMYWQVRSYGFLNWKCHWSFFSAIWDFLFGYRGETRNSLRRSN